MWRFIGGTVAGVIGWAIVVTLINLGYRHFWPGYVEAEKAIAFTLPIMVGRLSMSAVSSLISGYVAASVQKGRGAALAAGVVILLPFLPIHYALWNKLPIWYHLTFLVSLPLLSYLGGRLVRAPDMRRR